MGGAHLYAHQTSLMLIHREFLLERMKVAKRLPRRIEARRPRVEKIEVSGQLTRTRVRRIKIMGQQPALSIEEIALCRREFFMSLCEQGRQGQRVGTEESPRAFFRRRAEKDRPVLLHLRGLHKSGESFDQPYRIRPVQ